MLATPPAPPPAALPDPPEVPTPDPPAPTRAPEELDEHAADSRSAIEAHKQALWMHGVASNGCMARLRDLVVSACTTTPRRRSGSDRSSKRMRSSRRGYFRPAPTSAGATDTDFRNEARLVAFSSMAASTAVCSERRTVSARSISVSFSSMR
jgi:hypothetical protein